MSQSDIIITLAETARTLSALQWLFILAFASLVVIGLSQWRTRGRTAAQVRQTDQITATITMLSGLVTRLDEQREKSDDYYHAQIETIRAENRAKASVDAELFRQINENSQRTLDILDQWSVFANDVKSQHAHQEEAIRHLAESVTAVLTAVLEVKSTVIDSQDTIIKRLDELQKVLSLAQVSLKNKIEDALERRRTDTHPVLAVDENSKAP